MKKSLIALAVCAVCAVQVAHAQTIPAAVKTTNAFVALVVGPFAVPYAAATGQLPALCKALGGTYDAKGKDQCPDGQWSALLGFIPQKK